MSSVLTYFVGAAGALYLTAVAIMFFAQRHFLYFPDPVRTAPMTAGLPDVEERILETPDGERIIAWYGKAKPGQPTLLYFHGNGAALDDRRERIRAYLDLGRGVYMMSYRG
ncbi:MAG: alpha/beta hydrolase, partial [Hyphomicrobium sp.]